MKKIITMVLILITALNLSVCPEAAGSISYHDVKKSDEYADAIYYLTELGAFSPDSKGNFRPNSNITVEEFLKAFQASMGYVLEEPKDDWSKYYIMNAKDFRIIKDGEFKDYKKPITRGEIARMIVRMLQEKYPSNIELYTYLIKDFKSIKPDFQDSVLKVYVKGIVTGHDDGTFKADDFAKRAEAALMIQRFFDPHERSQVIKPLDAATLKQLKSYADCQQDSYPKKEDYESNTKYLETRGMDTAIGHLLTAKGLIETEFNVDYRKLDSNYINQLKYYFMPGAPQNFWLFGEEITVEEYLQNRVDDVKKYKISSKAQFLSDWNMVYLSKNSGTRVRGRLKVCYSSLDKEYLKKYDTKLATTTKYPNIKNFQVGKWYYIDIEVELADKFSNEPNKWLHTEYTFRKYIFLGEFKEMK